MTTGLAILVLALLAAAGVAAYRRRVDGRFDDGHREGTEPVGDDAETTWGHVSAALPKQELGERATLVQFSSAFCAPCRTTRVLLADVADTEDGVRHIEVDAERHLDLVRALDVRRTPTTLVLDAGGHEVVRASGAPQRHQVLAALPRQEVSR